MRLNFEKNSAIEEPHLRQPSATLLNTWGIVSRIGYGLRLAHIVRDGVSFVDAKPYSDRSRKPPRAGDSCFNPLYGQHPFPSVAR